ncbi:MAG TPA: DUF4058 family protein, partial [Gemmataceae bacterium]|nr:DUF4058 family protein [Gemmataceae bacterium]
EDFHQHFITHAQETLSGEVGPNYIVKVEVRLILHELSADERRYFGRADVGVTGRPPADVGTPSPSVVAAPYRIPLPAIDPVRISSIEVVDRRDRRVVTVMELLSPTNKTPGPDRDDYLRKRNLLLEQRVHVVEIDLRRGGERPHYPPLPRCDYYVLVSRWQDRPIVGVWPLGLHDRLPVIPVPLTPPDADVTLDLQALLHRVYDAAGYAKYIYAETPEPSLSEQDLAWARQYVPG